MTNLTIETKKNKIFTKKKEVEIQFNSSLVFNFKVMTFGMFYFVHLVKCVTLGLWMFQLDLGGERE